MSAGLAAWLAAGNRPTRRNTPARRDNILNIGAKIDANPALSRSTARLSPAQLNPAVEQPVNPLVERLGATFAALADPTRRVILIMLREGDRSVVDLARPHRMSLAAVAKHVKVLERAGLVARRREGQRQLCTLVAEPLREAHAALARWQGCWHGPGDA